MEDEPVDGACDGHADVIAAGSSPRCNTNTRGVVRAGDGSRRRLCDLDLLHFLEPVLWKAGTRKDPGFRAKPDGGGLRGGTAGSGQVPRNHRVLRVDLLPARSNRSRARLQCIDGKTPFATSRLRVRRKNFYAV